MTKLHESNYPHISSYLIFLISVIFTKNSFSAFQYNVKYLAAYSSNGYVGPSFSN